MSRFHSRRILLLSAGILSAVFLLGACKAADPIQRLSKTPENFPLEVFVPESSAFVVSIFPNSLEQATLLGKHTATVLGQYEKPFMDFVFSKVFSKDIFGRLAPVFEEKEPSMLVAFFPDETLKTRLGFFAVARTAQQESLRAKLLEPNTADGKDEAGRTDENFTSQDINGKILFEDKEDRIFGALNASYLFLSTSKELIPADAVPPKKTPLLENKLFREFLKKGPETFTGYSFSSFETSDPKQSLQDFIPSKFFPKNGASMAFFRAEEEGIRTISYLKFPAGKDVDPLVSDLSKGSKIGLANRLKSENAIFYAEGFNLGLQLRLQKKLLMEDPFFAVRQGEGFFKNIENRLGFTLEGDLFPVLSKNYAILVEDQGKVMPAVSIYVDAGANPISAKKIFSKLDSAVNSFSAGLQLAFPAKQEDATQEDGKQESSGGPEALSVAVPTPPAIPILTHKEIELYGGKAKQVIFSPKQFAETREISLPLFEAVDETWEFTYGLTADNLFFVSTRGNFPQTVFADNISYKISLPAIKGFDETDHMFLDPAPLTQYASRIAELGKANGKISETQLQGFEVLKNVLQNMQSFVTGVKRKGKFLENQSFAKIGR